MDPFAQNIVDLKGPTNTWVGEIDAVPVYMHLSPREVREKRWKQKEHFVRLGNLLGKVLAKAVNV